MNDSFHSIHVFGLHYSGASTRDGIARRLIEIIIIDIIIIIEIKII